MQTRILPVTPFEQNCTLLWDEDSRIGAVVDPGGEVPRILAAIQEEGLHIEKILVTHGHIDHAGGVADLAEALQVPVEGPQEEDKFWLEGMPLQAERFGFPPVRSFTPDRWLAQGDRVQVGPLTLEVLHCPGHTPGHVVFFHRPSALALVGDVLFAGSIGRTDFPRGDLRWSRSFGQPPGWNKLRPVPGFWF